MKTNLFSIQQFRKRCAVTSFLIATCLLSMNAQIGSNDHSFNATDRVASQGTDNEIEVLVIQPDNKIIIAGGFTQYNGAVANKIARLKSNGKLDNTFNAGSGPDGLVHSIVVQPDRKILIGGDFNRYNGDFINNFGKLNVNGSLDGTFHPRLRANNAISTVLLQPDGKILLAGMLKYTDSTIKTLERLNNDGTTDATFRAVITDSIRTIEQIALQPDGKIIVSGKERARWSDMQAIIRLNRNGSRDYSFNDCKFDFGDLHFVQKSIAVESDGRILLAGTLYDAGGRPYHGLFLRLSSSGTILVRSSTFWINDLKLQSDGKILIAGLENFERDSVRRKIIRMNRDLTTDATFQYKDKKVYNSSSKAEIKSIGLQTGGKIVIAGDFIESNELIVNNIASLNRNGDIVYTFNERSGCNGTVNAVAEQTNGKLIIAGGFSKFNGFLKSNLVRLNRNGAVDRSFNVGTGTDGPVQAVAIQPDGKILIGGTFTTYNGIRCNNIARINTDGSLDASFGSASTDGAVRKITLTKEDKIIIGGDFKHVNGTSKNALARLLRNGTLDVPFNPVIPPSAAVYDCQISSTGMIYTVINFTRGHGMYAATILRFDRSGTLDPTFSVPADKFQELYVLAFTNDGKILTGGSGRYPARNGVKGIVAKLNLDGSVDAAFNNGSLADYLKGNVRTINVLSTNKIIIGGDFVYGGGSFMNHIGLLNSDGTVNYDFTETTDRSVYATAMTDDKLVIAGIFGEYSGIVRNSVARIYVVEGESLKRAQNGPATATTSDGGFLIYPNPASTAITIDNLEIGSTITILNPVGQVVQTRIVTNEKAMVELADYSNGMYFVIEENKDKKITRKLVVNK